MKNLYYVGAVWCTGCNVQKALLKNLNVFDKFQQIDVDVDMEFAQKHGVRNIPQLLLIEDDKVIKSLGSGASKDSILEMVKHAEAG